MASKEIKLQSLQGPAKATLSDYKDRTDPKYVGPGTWDFLTRLAAKANTHELELEFEREMKEACFNFPCSVCSGHCTKYMAENPIKDFYGYFITIKDKKVIIGMFMWIWKFHNVVNARLNKPLMSWDTAYNIYYPSEVLFCSQACMEAENNIPPPVKTAAKTPPVKSQPVKTHFKMVSYGASH